MYNYIRNSLYETMETDEMSVLRNEIEKEIIKDEVVSYNKKLIGSVELEKYYSKKLKDVSRLIVELKEKSQELTNLKCARDSLKKEYTTDKNAETKEQFLAVEEEYYRQLDDFIAKITDVLKIDLSELVSKHEIEHTKLISVLKEYRLKLKEEIESQKSEREKIITIMEKGLCNKFDSTLGVEICNLLKKEALSYNIAMQNELKQHGLHQTEEVLLRLKILTTLYGYKKSDLTPDFIQRELDSIKCKVKLYMPIYRNIQSDLKKISESKMSEIKLVFLSEAKENIELKINKLKQRKDELEEQINHNNEKIKLKELTSQNNKRKRELEELTNTKRICLENHTQADSSSKLSQIQDEIDKKQAEIALNDKKIYQLNNPQKPIFILQGLESLLNLGGIQLASSGKISPEDMPTSDESHAENLDLIHADDESESDHELDYYDSSSDNEYALLSPDELKNINDELDKINSDLPALQKKLDAINDEVEFTKSIVEKYEDLKEQREEKKNDILEELEKYDILKDLTEAFFKSKNPSYQYLYI